MEKENEEIRISYLDISMQWNPKVKTRTLVKDEDARRTPISPELRDELDHLKTGSGRFLFPFNPEQDHPITANRLREWDILAWTMLD